jgi:hypothetical protein
VLVGTKSNRNGLGATVRVHSGGQTYTRYNDGKAGYLSRKQIIRKGLTDNQTLKITEPEK